MPTTHDDEDLLQIDEDAMEEIDIRWQVAMITARIRKQTMKILSGPGIDAEPDLMILTGATKRMSIQYPSFDGYNSENELAIRNKVVNQEKIKSNQSAIDRNKVIIEDWVDSDDEETDVSESQKETAFNSENSETSFENRSPNSQNSVGQESRTKGLGNKGGKLCFGNPVKDLKDYAIIDRGCSEVQATEDEAVLCTEDWGMSTYKNINKICKRVNSTGHLARRLRKNCQEPLELLPWTLFGPVFSREYKTRKSNAWWSLMTAANSYGCFSSEAYRLKHNDMLHDLIVGLENS
ncbi:hypothetical protein Tco_0316667 [Tanacetum coccineum]